MSDQRRRAEQLFARSRQLEAAASTGEGPRRTRGFRRGARSLLDQVERGLDELRARGYVENADGSWTAPDGRVIRR